MKKLFAGVLAVTAMAGGCQSGNKQAAAKPQLRPSVTDIAPTPPAYLAPAQPIQPVTPIAAAPDQAAPASFSGGAVGGSYTVLKGDTLYKSARERYGDGKQWQRIAAANPGLSPGSLKVGQKIAIP